MQGFGGRFARALATFHRGIKEESPQFGEFILETLVPLDQG